MTSKRPSETLSKRVKTVLNEFGGKTSIAGLSNAYQSESTSKRIYWGILFLIGSFITVNTTIGVIVDYLEFEVTTSTDLRSDPSVVFPAVSVCNLNK